MKNLIVIVSGLLALGSLVTGAQTLTKTQVKEIADLVFMREHKINLPITKVIYDKKTDVWTCLQDAVLAPGLDIRMEVRDSDRHYRRIYGLVIGPKSNKFRMSPKLRKEILAIEPKHKD